MLERECAKESQRNTEWKHVTWYYTSVTHTKRTLCLTIGPMPPLPYWVWVAQNRFASKNHFHLKPPIRSRQVKTCNRAEIWWRFLQCFSFLSITNFLVVGIVNTLVSKQPSFQTPTIQRALSLRSGWVEQCSLLGWKTLLSTRWALWGLRP